MCLEEEEEGGVCVLCLSLFFWNCSLGSSKYKLLLTYMAGMLTAQKTDKNEAAYFPPKITGFLLLGLGLEYTWEIKLIFNN